MFDESILELEEIEGEERWHSSVVEARHNTYRDAKEWELAMTMAKLMYERKPSSFKWCKNLVDSMTECGDPTGALQLPRLVQGVWRRCQIYFHPRSSVCSSL